MHIYAHDNIRMEISSDNCIVIENFTTSIVDFMVANIRLLAPQTRRQKAQFATIKSPIHAVKLSNTIQLSSNFTIFIIIAVDIHMMISHYQHHNFIVLYLKFIVLKRLINQYSAALLGTLFVC